MIYLSEKNKQKEEVNLTTRFIVSVASTIHYNPLRGESPPDSNLPIYVYVCMYVCMHGMCKRIPAWPNSDHMYVWKYMCKGVCVNVWDK
jgi:hypothetical protein